MTPEQKKRLVVVPMKDPAHSKTRLSPDLSDLQRAELALSLFQRTLQLLCELRDVIGAEQLDLLVVTSSPDIRAEAKALSIPALAEPTPGSLNGALQHAAKWGEERGYKSLIILPADLAMPEPDELIQLLTHPLDTHRVVLCPAQDMGTNALLMALPSALPLQYGPRSFLRHFKSAEEAGLNPMMLPLNSLKRDVDTSKDLSFLQDRDPELFRLLRTT